MDLGFLSDAANSEYIHEVLSSKMQANLTQYLIMVGVVWRLMKQNVAGHFEAVTAGLEKVANEVSELRAAMERVETNHEKRLGTLEGRVDSLVKLKE